MECESWELYLSRAHFSLARPSFAEFFLGEHFVLSTTSGRERPSPPFLPPPSPARSPPPSGGCGRGVGWRHYNSIRPAATRRFLALVYGGDTRMVVVSFTTSPFFKKNRREFRAPQRRYEKGLCLLPVSAIETHIYTDRGSRPSGRCLDFRPYHFIF